MGGRQAGIHTKENPPEDVCLPSVPFTDAYHDPPLQVGRVSAEASHQLRRRTPQERPVLRPEAEQNLQAQRLTVLAQEEIGDLDDRHDEVPTWPAVSLTLYLTTQKQA